MLLYMLWSRISFNSREIKEDVVSNGFSILLMYEIFSRKSHLASLVAFAFKSFLGLIKTSFFKLNKQVIRNAHCCLLICIGDEVNCFKFVVEYIHYRQKNKL